MVPEHPGGRAAATGWQAGTAKMEEMEKIVVRMGKIIVRMEKIVVSDTTHMPMCGCAV